MRPTALEIVAGTFAAVIAPWPTGGVLGGLDLLPPLSDLGRDPDALRNLSPEDRAAIREEILREGGVDAAAFARRLPPHKVPQ